MGVPQVEQTHGNAGGTSGVTAGRDRDMGVFEETSVWDKLAEGFGIGPVSPMLWRRKGRAHR